MNPIPVLYTTFNRLEYTKKTLPVLIENTPGGMITIIDNGSDDGTKEYLNNIRTLNLSRVILNVVNEGITAAMNTFFALTDFRTPYIAKVDNDTLVPPDWLENLKHALIYEQLDAIQAKHFFDIRGAEDWNDLESKSKCVPGKGGKIVFHSPIGGSAVVFKRSLFGNMGLDAEINLYGWSNFQLKNGQLKTAFHSGVEVGLLDMAGYNKHREDVDKDYYNKTGRTLRKGA